MEANDVNFPGSWALKLLRSGPNLSGEPLACAIRRNEGNTVMPLVRNIIAELIYSDYIAGINFFMFCIAEGCLIVAIFASQIRNILIIYSGAVSFSTPLCVYIFVDISAYRDHEIIFSISHELANFATLYTVSPFSIILGAIALFCAVRESMPSNLIATCALILSALNFVWTYFIFHL